jgi:hypothetical protein
MSRLGGQSRNAVDASFMAKQDTIASNKVIATRPRLGTMICETISGAAASSMAAYSGHAGSPRHGQEKNGGPLRPWAGVRSRSIADSAAPPPTSSAVLVRIVINNNDSESTSFKRKSSQVAQAPSSAVASDERGKSKG